MFPIIFSASIWRLLSTSTLTLLLLNFVTIFQPSIAQPSPPTFDDVGSPSDTAPGGRRGELGACPVEDGSVYPDILPLLPEGIGGAWTTVAPPKIWVYLPFGFEQYFDVKLIVNPLDDNGEVKPNDVVGREWLTVQPSQPGIHQFSLPLTEENFPIAVMPTGFPDPEALEPSQTYAWTLEIFCNPSGGDPAIVSGTIRRVEANLARYSAEQLNTPDGLSRAYADQRIWYDAVTVLGEARLAEPNNADYEAAWQELLSYPTVGLGAIADQPLVNCCTSLNE